MEHGVTDGAIPHVKSGFANMGWCLHATSDVPAHAMHATALRPLHPTNSGRELLRPEALACGITSDGKKNILRVTAALGSALGSVLVTAKLSTPILYICISKSSAK